MHVHAGAEALVPAVGVSEHQHVQNRNISVFLSVSRWLTGSPAAAAANQQRKKMCYYNKSELGLNAYAMMWVKILEDK